MYLTKPPGYNLMIFAQPCSGIVYDANEIGIVLIAVQKIGKKHK